MKRQKDFLKWGIFRVPDATHVAPCNRYGSLYRGHTLSEDCPCGPAREKVSGRIDGLGALLTHRNMEEREGELPWDTQ